MAGGIVALDISTNCGYAHADPAARIYSGTKYFKGYGARHGALMLEFHDWLDMLLNALKPHLLVWEAPIFTGGFQEKILLLTGMSGITDMLGAKHEVRRAEIVHYATLKKAWTGDGRAQKDAMVRAARMRGFDPKDDNEADALALICYAAGKHKMAVQYPDGKTTCL